MLSFRRTVLPVEGAHPPWARDIVKYIMEHALPEYDHDAERVARQAKLYVMIDGKLYRLHPSRTRPSTATGHPRRHMFKSCGIKITGG